MPNDIDMEMVAKVSRLEGDFKNLTEAMEKLTGKVDKLNNTLEQAKGARWVLVGIVALAISAGTFLGKWFTITPIR
jgi:nitrate/nitrite-specific signal transduction histidine kinase